MDDEILTEDEKEEGKEVSKTEDETKIEALIEEQPVETEDRKLSISMELMAKEAVDTAIQAFKTDELLPIITDFITNLSGETMDTFAQKLFAGNYLKAILNDSIIPTVDSENTVNELDIIAEDIRKALS